MSILQKYCDTHAHLDFPQFDEDREEVIANSFDAGVVRIVNVGVDIESSRHAIAIAEKYPRIWAAVGIHPNMKIKNEKQWIDIIEKMATHPKVIAIGEIGLDYYRESIPKNEQKTRFVLQIEIAKKHRLPMIIHIRDAHDEAREILEGEKYYFGVMHAFSGSENFHEWSIDKGFYIGYGGLVTFKNYRGKNIPEKTPVGKILLETDCPYLSPHPHRGMRNEPKRIPIISAEIAKIKSIDTSVLAKPTSNNAARLFGFPSPYGYTGSKRMGQNFLKDKDIAQKIAVEAGSGPLAVEIGAGSGILTKPLSKGFAKLLSIELDEKLAVTLNKIMRRYINNKKANKREECMDFQSVIVINKDILNISLGEIMEYYGAKAVLVGNIPYSISSKILFWMLEQKESYIRAVLMLQREVAQRLLAKPSCKEYGIPTVLLGRHLNIEKIVDVDSKSFSPRPNVQSTVLRFTPRERSIYPEVDDKIFTSLVRAAFMHRRKKMINNLANFQPHVEWKEIFGNIGISENTRAEQLSIEKFCEITAQLKKN